MFNSSVFNGISFDKEPVPLKTGKAGGWGMTYYWVSLPVTTDDVADTQNFDTILEWCLFQFGKPGSRWFEKNKQFHFKDEKDMTIFLLRVG